MSELEEPVFKFNKESGEYEEVKKKIVKHMPAVENSQNITLDKLRSHLPKKYGGEVSEAVLAELNNIEEDTGLPQNYMEETVLGSMHMLDSSGKTLRGLINAQKYCNLREHMSNKAAWSIVFPKEADRLVAGGKFMDSHVSMYNKSKLVIQVMKSMLTASNITLQPQRMAAIQVQLNLMNGTDANGNPASATVQQLASAKIIDMTEMDKDNTVVMRIGQTDDAKEATMRMTNQIGEVARLIQSQIASGKSVESVQALNLTHGGIDDDIEDVEVN